MIATVPEPDYHYYGRRMLNPFHGIVNVVERPCADAVSRDGLSWTLYILGERSLELCDDGITRAVQTPDIKYGTWTPKLGLIRGPVRSVTSYAHVEQQGSRLLAAIEASLAFLPFPLGDKYELWLLDKDNDLPLALIDSACTLEELREDIVPQWNPGIQARQAFHSPSLHTCPEMNADICHAELIAQMVRAATGHKPRAQWFERVAGGNGIGLEGISINHRLYGRRINHGCFPELLLREEWSIPWVRALVGDFLAWQSPWLLLLQHLKTDTRAKLEGVAIGRAEEVALQYRLYPEMLNPKWIMAALVKARLRAASDIETVNTDAVLTPFYIET